MSEFGVLDISSTVRMLYSVSELDVDEADEMMNTIIKRNYEIIDKYEENKNQNPSQNNSLNEFTKSE